MKPKRLYLSPPDVRSPKEREYLLDAFDSNWIAPLGPHVDAFEHEIVAEITGTSSDDDEKPKTDRYAVALTSGTAALHLALKLLDVGPGDEVLVSALTFSASANPVVYLGAQPVFLDSERATWNLDPNLLEEELVSAARKNRLPKALVAVDLYGQCVDYEPVLEICGKYGVPVIEDAAEALGSRYRGEKAGSFGTSAVFSFNGNKIITSGGGGMLIAGREDLARKARFWATQARDPAPHYQHSEIGYNYRMSNLCAAVGRGQLLTLADRVAARRANFRRYEAALSDLPGLHFMPEPPGFASNRWLTCLTIDAKTFGTDRETVRLALEAENIEARPVWKPMHLQPVFAKCRYRGSDVAATLFRDGLCLPSGSDLEPEDLHRVVEIIRQQYRVKNRS